MDLSGLLEVNFEEGDTPLLQPLLKARGQATLVGWDSLAGGFRRKTRVRATTGCTVKIEPVKLGQLVASFAEQIADTAIQCRVCLAAVENQDDLDLHMMAMHEDDDDPLPSVLAPRSEDEPTEPAFVCRQCFKPFPSHSGLAEHMRVHLGEGVKIFTCAICQLRFNSPTRLATHVMTHKVVGTDHETDQHACKCPECGKCFRTNRLLRQHRKIHAENRTRNFKCATCSSAFFVKYKLARHMKIHEKDGTFSPPVKACPTFRVEPAPTVTVPPPSAKASTVTITRVDRSSPPSSPNPVSPLLEADHRPFPCPICRKMFRTKKLVRSHKVVHNQNRVRSHVCQICSRGFYVKFKLERHMKIHERTQPDVLANPDDS